MVKWSNDVSGYTITGCFLLFMFLWEKKVVCGSGALYFDSVQFSSWSSDVTHRGIFIFI